MRPSLDLGWIALATLLLSATLAFVARRMALASGLLDMPNERSSHQMPTPRGGGAAIVTASYASFVLLTATGAMQRNLLIALCGGLLVAGVGFLDDRRAVPAGLRLMVHLLAAGWALAWLGGMPSMRLGALLLTWGAGGYLVGILVIVWVLNLFNFMDGIDGIATSEAIFICCAAGLILRTTGIEPGVLHAAWLLGAACCGFLLWNWPPAKIFMGDVGSGYLGYAIAVLALAGARQDAASPLVWLILGGAFFVDATVTLLRRLARGEPVHHAHRSHAYQWLARRWLSHARPTIAVILLNLLWLLPCAVFACWFPERAGWITLLALGPLVVLALFAGAGRREQPLPRPDASNDSEH